MLRFFYLLSLLAIFNASSLPAQEEQQINEEQVVILGGGVGALTAAVYLSRAGFTPIVITGPSIGGAVTQSTKVQNWPGEISISGVELSDKIKKQAEANGAILRQEVVTSVDFSKRPFLITTKRILGDENPITYRTQAVIIALGAEPNLLQVPGESRYWSKGVYSCAVCDGWNYKDKEVAVVGGGDSALVEATYLAPIASKVHILVRKDYFRSLEKKRLREVLSNPKIEIHYNTVVDQIKGDQERLTHIVLRTSDEKNPQELFLDAVFLAIGSRPNTGLFQGQLELDSSGYIALKKYQETSIKGVFAIGDVADPRFKQVVSAAGDAAKASIQTQEFLGFREVAQDKTPSKEKARQEGVVEVRSKAQFFNELKNAEGAVFADFYSTHCGPCRAFTPLYEDWSRRYGKKIKFLKINTEHALELFQEYQIQAIPTLVIFDNKGNVMRKSTGFREIADVEKKLVQMKDQTDFLPQDFIPK